jgi:hypothetical protein
MPFACFHLLSTCARNNDGSNPESRKQGKRAVESAVLSGVNLKIHSALRQRTLQPGTISNFGLEILSIRRCAFSKKSRRLLVGASTASTALLQLQLM